MTRDETIRLLKRRSGATMVPYGEDTIEIWHAALLNEKYTACETALVKACRRLPVVKVSDVVSLLITPGPEPTPKYEGYPEGTPLYRATDPLAMAAVLRGIVGTGVTVERAYELLEKNYDGLLGQA